MLAVQADLLELRSCLRVASMKTGQTLWESKARANKAPAARAEGAVITAKEGRIWKKGSEDALATYAGEVLLAIAKDGSSALVVDEKGVRVFHLETGKVTIQLTRAKVEEETIDIVDEALFDAENRPCVKVGRHAYLVEPTGVVARPSPRRPRNPR
jgi:hypothetical protein